MKRIFLTFLFVLISLASNAIIQSGTCGKNGNNVTFVLNDDGTLVISGIGEMYDFDDFLNTVKWYGNQDRIVKVQIEDGVTSIGNYAFRDCTGLVSVTFPNSITRIGSYAFRNCTSLISVYLPNSVTNIGSYAFYHCTSLTSVTIPNSVRSINDYAFYGCTSLASVTIPNSVRSINDYAFSGCTSLASVTIPNSVTGIGTAAFANCSGLTSVTIPNSITNIWNRAFSACSSLTSVTIPNSVSIINENTFAGCISLSSVTIPNSVKDIWTGAFKDCSSLTSVSIPNSVSTIYDYAFSNCSSLISVNIPNSVTSIGKSVFSGCSDLTSVTIPNSITEIPYGTFSGCTSLTSVTIPNSIEYIKGYVFSDCSNLTSVTIPNSVKAINSYAFQRCLSLKSVYCYATEVPSGGSMMFYASPTSSATLYVPSSSIGAYESQLPWSTFGTILPLAIPVTNITITTIRNEITVGKTMTLTAIVSPKDATDTTVTWSSSNEAVATINNMGVVTAIAVGETIITAKSSNDKTATCKIIVTEDVDQTASYFRTSNSEILKKNTSTITSADLDAINKALEDYENLSDAAKTKLTEEKNLLDSLKQKAEEIKAAEEADAAATAEANQFKIDNADILSKSTVSVTSTDLDAINAALNAFENLSEAAKAKLRIEKNLLDSLKQKAEELKAAEDADAAATAEANQFKSDNANILGKSTTSVTSADLDEINAALNDYENLSEAAKAKLTEEKEQLDALKAKAEELKAAEEADAAATAEAELFKTDNATILGKTTATVTSGDLDAINKALEDYDKLSDAAKAKLAAEKALLDILKKKAEELANSIYSINADKAIETYYNMNGQRVNSNAKGLIIKNGKKVMMK